jgi:UDPglucose--hexose-1-phosphate uridylyltransferase
VITVGGNTEPLIKSAATFFWLRKMIELRKDYVLDKYIILPAANEETQVPASEKSSCPYCPGNENMTLPSVLSLVVNGGMLQRLSDSEENLIEGWSVRVFPSNSPIVTQSPENHYSEKPLYSEPAYGFHYIVVSSPNHEDTLDSLSLEQWSNVLLMIQDRVRWLYSQKSVTYVAIYVNEGSKAGSNVDHSHFNLVTFSTIPPTIESEAEASNQFMNENGNCPACTVIAAETAGPRQILSTDNYLAFSPWASSYPYEFWIYPKRHTTAFTKITQKEISDLALILRSTLGGLSKALSSPHFNLVFHLSPEKKNSRQIHWHIEIYPQLNNFSGLERGFGVFVNRITPEKSAEILGSACRRELANLVGIQ